MLQEYAVEPQAIGSSWETFRFLIEKFGLDKGRLISRLPNKWEKKVIQCAKEAGVPEVRMASIIERLRSTAKLRVVDFGRHYDVETPWIDNALREHARRPFRGIICAGEERPCAEALGADDCDEENVLFAASTSFAVTRTADGISDALLLLAASAREIDIIDPYFDLRPAEGDFLSPLSALMQKLSAIGVAGKTIRIHFRTHDSRPPDNILLRDAPGLTRGSIAPGYVLELYEWAEIKGGEDFHDRFFLTDAGGLMMGAGLAAAGANQTANFTLLDDSFAQIVRGRYAATATTYQRVGSAIIIDSNGNASFV